VTELLLLLLLLQLLLLLLLVLLLLLLSSDCFNLAKTDSSRPAEFWYSAPGLKF
jgi:hypothetical protein